MTIFVTSEHIKRGKTVNALECPISHALRDTFSKKFVVVAKKQIKVGARFYKTPPEAEAFVEAFDNGKEVKPFSFVLD